MLRPFCRLVACGKYIPFTFFHVLRPRPLEGEEGRFSGEGVNVPWKGKRATAGGERVNVPWKGKRAALAAKGF
jgi:hypothetical protein